MTGAIAKLDADTQEILTIYDSLERPDQLAFMDFVREMSTGHFKGWAKPTMWGWLTKRRRYYRELFAAFPAQH